MQALEKTEQQHAIADIVDPPRHALARLVNRQKSRIGDIWVALPGCAAQSMFDVFLRFVDVQRTKMVHGGDALAQLFEL